MAKGNYVKANTHITRMKNKTTGIEGYSKFGGTVIEKTDKTYNALNANKIRNKTTYGLKSNSLNRGSFSIV